MPPEHAQLKMEFEVASIDEISPYLADVKLLWRANSDTLGFFPDGAFNDHAARRTILVALVKGECAGYLLYRIARRRVTVVHLCVGQRWRGTGIPKELVDTLTARTKAYAGIGLNCRRDYAASRVWPRLGFVAWSDRQGRSQDGHELTYWWLDHNHPNLWTAAPSAPEARITAVIDANIFFDLRGEARPQGDESKALLADWLQEAVELCVTSEMWNEINRSADSARRAALRQLVSAFREVMAEKAKVDAVAALLARHFPPHLKENDEADLRQVAKTIAAETQFFITRDGPLLERAESIYQEFKLRIIRPSDLIIRLDELRREAEYQPASLAATPLKTRLPHSGEQDALVAAFRQTDQGERQHELQISIRRFLSDPERFECRLTAEEGGEAAALLVYDRGSTDDLRVPLFRVARTRLSPTLARYHILLCLLQSAREGRLFTKISDPFLSPDVEAALQEDGFTRVTDTWVKASLPYADTAATIAARLDLLAAKGEQEAACCLEAATLLKGPEALKDVQAMGDIERLLWPAKVLDADVPSFVISIRPPWAHALFDTDLARQTLFGADPALALNREAVYYRSAKQRILTSPSRVLWYVSQDKSYEGSASIRACSQVVEVVVGKPKDLFRRFQRLGVYEWRDLLKLADKDIETDIMAIRFRNTELLSAPVPWGEISKILKGFGEPSQFQAPHRISREAFATIYGRATQKDKP